MPSDNQRPREPRTFWYTLARILLYVLGPIFFPAKYHHKERVSDLDAPYILISNHVSLLDPLIIPLPIKRYEVRFMGKDELVKNPILGYVVRKLHMFAVSRHATDMAAMRAANEVLKKGHVLAMFPEGTRKAPEELMEGVESGVSLIALRNRVPLMPVYIHGNPGPFKRVHVYYLPAIDYSHLLDKGMGKDVIDELTQLMADTYRAARESVLKTGDITSMEA